MQKTSFRIPEEVSTKLEELAKKCHNGNKSAALCAAIEKAFLSEFSQSVGWVSIRVREKAFRCKGCNNPIEQTAFTRLLGNGQLEGGLFCGKCAK
jgi:uncharacterized protein with PIN domain